ncbi:MAG: response regulator transcription factor [Desulfobacteraceae bacterium]|nr:response regulator transcription factor [Desulfobacteraceae bacterium]
MPDKKKIILVEDHPIFRLGLAEIINQEEDLTVCGWAKNLTQGLKAIETHAPDLVIADITLEDSDGIDFVKQAKQKYKDLPVLVLSMHDEHLYAQRALHAGARGYIMKQEAMESVISAIHHVLEGKIFLNDCIKDQIISNISNQSVEDANSPDKLLTDRELEVFKLIGLGLSSREIAEKLFLSIKTIGTYRERIKDKLNLKHANELLRCAVHFDKTEQIIP